jgi:hypothetical protein
MAEAKNKGKAARDEARRKTRETGEMVRDYTEDSVDIAKELTKQVRDSYLTSFKLGLSLWENNIKMVNEYIGQWLSLQQELYTSFVDMINPRSGDVYFGRDLIERAFSLQRDYIDEVRNLSEREIERVGGEVKEAAS